MSSVSPSTSQAYTNSTSLLEIARLPRMVLNSCQETWNHKSEDKGVDSAAQPAVETVKSTLVVSAAVGGAGFFQQEVLASTIVPISPMKRLWN